MPCRANCLWRYRGHNVDQYINKTITGIFAFNAYNDSLGYKKTVTQGVIRNLPFEY